MRVNAQAWLGNMEMTSNCDVINSAHQKQITTIWPWTKPPHENFLRTPLLTWRLQSWQKGNCTASPQHHSLWQTAQCESHLVRGAPAVGASLRDFPLTWRRNTQIQMYWLWQWLESYNNRTFSTWKDKFLFNLLFWIPNLFCTFHDYGRGGTPFLASPDGPSLIFYYSDFWTTFLPWKKSCPETFHCVQIFFIFQDFWTTCACPEKHSVPWIHCIEYIFLIIQNFEQHALALEFLIALKYFLFFRIFEELCACPENRVCHEIFDCI